MSGFTSHIALLGRPRSTRNSGAKLKRRRTYTPSPSSSWPGPPDSAVSRTRAVLAAEVGGKRPPLELGRAVLARGEPGRERDVRARRDLARVEGGAAAHEPLAGAPVVAAQLLVGDGPARVVDDLTRFEVDAVE